MATKGWALPVSYFCCPKRQLLSQVVFPMFTKWQPAAFGPEASSLKYSEEVKTDFPLLPYKNQEGQKHLCLPSWPESKIT